MTPAERAPRPSRARRRARLAAVLAALALAGCLEAGPGPGAGPGEAPFDEPLRELDRGPFADRAPEGTRVLEDAAAWEAYWRALHACDDATRCPPAPPVDFATERVLAVALGERPDGCHGVEIRSARTDPAAGVTTARVVETVPGPGMACPDVVTRPYHVVAAPARATSVTFAMERATASPGAGETR